MSAPLLNIQNLCVLQRLNNVSLRVSQGEIVGILGQNGAGKSTLLNALAGVCNFSGTIFIKGENFKKIPPQKRAQQIAMIFQNQKALWDIKVLDIVRLGRLPWRDKNDEAVFNAIRMTELESFQNRRISDLSGGEAARVFLARALANTPELLLADEITANLDPFYQKKIGEILKNFANKKGTVLMVMHDIAFAAAICNRILFLKKGSVLSIGETQKMLTSEFLSQVFETEMPDFSKKLDVDRGKSNKIVKKYAQFTDF